MALSVHLNYRKLENIDIVSNFVILSICFYIGMIRDGEKYRKNDISLVSY